jgi:dTDP-4-amino-4,6-dideoxygalactose transaminase
MYYLLFPDIEQRTGFIAGLKARGIGAVFHYVPLHSSPSGRNRGRTGSPLPLTDSLSSRLVRMPLWVGLEEHLDEVLEASDNVIAELA